MMFDEYVSENSPQLDWENVESYKGNHNKLKEFFVDKDHPSWAMVGNNDFVITRNVNNSGNSKGSGVCFSIYKRDVFIKSTYFYLKNNNRI